MTVLHAPAQPWSSSSMNNGTPSVRSMMRARDLAEIKPFDCARSTQLAALFASAGSSASISTCEGEPDPGRAEFRPKGNNQQDRKIGSTSTWSSTRAR